MYRMDTPANSDTFTMQQLLFSASRLRLLFDPSSNMQKQQSRSNCTITNNLQYALQDPLINFLDCRIWWHLSLQNLTITIYSWGF